MKPLVKYRGGKSKEIPLFIKYIPDDFDTYYEPFFGGGAVFFYLEPQRAVINDVNARLMAFYEDVQSKYHIVRQQLNELQALYEANQSEYKRLKALAPTERVENKNEALYYELRDMFNHKIESKYLDSVVYFFINKTAYSGMIRYNAQGEYNVPFGRYQNFNTQLMTQEHCNLLQRASLFTGDYSSIFEMTTENDFMFLDPPYDCVFNDYGNIDAANGFDEAEHRRLARDFRQLKCKAMMVIGKTPLTIELYGDLIKDEYFKSYAVNIRNRFKSESKHIIVTNY
ncbi:DNA adenine methylase [Anaerotignum lactatifermentans]|uniref:DNA adenine methylase n=1 Tax=Anaerotignum lactatifermentans TaxID=160404 RepID=UPI0026713053|nr:Dam family site-specific DNA-(adenine-N6)-methyltransferase [Anaerotignum lactatifermentans]